MSEKLYELRSLTADDIFPMVQILSKVGLKEIKNCFDGEDVKKAIKAMASGKNSEINVETVENSEINVEKVGIAVALDIASVIAENLPKCKDQIYQLLSQLSGMDKKQIAALPMATFIEMIIDVITQDGFKDFFQVVSKFSK